MITKFKGTKSVSSLEFLRYFKQFRYEKLGRDDEAEKAFKEGLSYDPEFCEILCNLGNLYRRRGMVAEAVRVFKLCDPIASNLTPETTALFYNNFGIALKSNGEFMQAKTFFMKALQLMPEKHPNFDILVNNYNSVGS